MGKELEELRRYKIDHEGRSPSGSISELPGRYRDLQNEIHKLKEVSVHFLFIKLTSLTSVLCTSFEFETDESFI